MKEAAAKAAFFIWNPDKGGVLPSIQGKMQLAAG
jgi:hypothetical protein